MMKELITTLMEKVLNTPEAIEQLKSALVNRDLAIEIDGKRFQITRRKSDGEELGKLKSKVYDLREALNKLLASIPTEVIKAGTKVEKEIFAARKILDK